MKKNAVKVEPSLAKKYLFANDIRGAFQKVVKNSTNC